eukprot:1139215-Pelagomonas_calceolata.AAC.1
MRHIMDKPHKTNACFTSCVSESQAPASRLSQSTVQRAHDSERSTLCQELTHVSSLISVDYHNYTYFRAGLQVELVGCKSGPKAGFSGRRMRQKSSIATVQAKTKASCCGQADEAFPLPNRKTSLGRCACMVKRG